MNVFLDTSSLVKLYYEENGTRELDHLIYSTDVAKISLAEISKVEFASTFWKKVRIKEIPESEAVTTLALFEADYEKYTFIPADETIIEQAKLLISKYGIQGLRTLDGIQFSTSLTLVGQVNVFITADQLLYSFFQAQGLPTEIPQR